MRIEMSLVELICVILGIMFVSWGAGYHSACRDIRKWIREEMKNDEEI